MIIRIHQRDSTDHKNKIDQLGSIYQWDGIG